MDICDHCAVEIPKKLPFSCKFCGGTFCKNHYLPENHNCLGLEIWKENKGIYAYTKGFPTPLKILLIGLFLLFLFLVLMKPDLLNISLFL